MAGYRGALSVACAALVALGVPGAVVAQGPSVLLVGPAGHPGAQYTSIQAAINAANPGDWVLVAPGVYHEHGGPDAGVLIAKPGVHLRGMNRNQVIVDGTKFSGAQRNGTAPAGSIACPSSDAAQDFGDPDGSNFTGSNGILVKGTTGKDASFVGNLANNVSIENLTVCNYLTGSHGNGNEIWWNGGDGSGKIGMHGLRGDYISATSTYIKTADGPAGSYGIFTSNEDGPGVIDHSYASNMRDSAYYIGACRNCNVVLTHAHAENSALGLSSTNAGGNFIVENGEWDLNRTGLVSNAQNNDDWPSPELGQCVPPSTPPTLGGITAGPNSCYAMFNNDIHDNNNANVPGAGLTAVSAVGAGVELAATQHISVIGNHIHNQGAWGVVAHDFPDPETGPSQCEGGVFNSASGVCVWFSRGNHVAGNRLDNNGGFGNPGNGDIANQATGLLDASGCPRGNDNNCIPAANADPNCFSANTDPAGLTEDPPNLPPGAGLQELACPPGASDTPLLTTQLVCATGAASLFTQGLITPPACPKLASYPQHNADCTVGYPAGINAVLTPAGDTVGGFCFLPMSRTLDAAVNPPMPDPCAGVPANAYCPTAADPGIALPNSAALRPMLAPALVGGLGAVGLAALALGARRRRRHATRG